jgi:hypothetical protein
MKLLRSKWGRLLILGYYVSTGLAGILLMLLIMCKFGGTAGIVFALAVGIVIGIIGGEIEFRDHTREEYRLRTRIPGIRLKQRKTDAKSDNRSDWTITIYRP